MRSPLIQRRLGNSFPRGRERGVTMLLVAVSISVVIAMAALSIDVGTLYEASAEAQRSADAAALAAARVLSLSGMTGDPTNSSGDWNIACTAAIQAAQSVAGQNFVGGVAPTTPTVTFSASDGTGCTNSGSGVAFGVNPQVTVKVANTNLPTFFAHVFGLFNKSWNTASVSATATAEVYNPSNSAAFDASTEMVPVQPRCVKPLIVPNLDPLNPPFGTNGYCTPGACQPFVDPGTGAIKNGGILLSGAGIGVIGETFNLYADCGGGKPTCSLAVAPQANSATGLIPKPKLQYVPSALSGTPVAVPSCGTATPFQQALAGCDQSTVYHCGVQAASLSGNANAADPSENPGGPNGEMVTATECLINESGKGPGNGQDTLSTASFPYQITAGSANPSGVVGNITSSDSIITIPIYDGGILTINGSNVAPVTIVGFLQVFINQVNPPPGGSLSVTVLNVAGCGNGSNATDPFATGTSPVPVRLITPSS